ncbi:hypothetical protein K7432_004778 [Basidiobolus ranarum]|uniref:RING-CH-type domain-containing protein n=1 Tax=Basidiobolus ranarum TaxID=34480 RepID=A0ABR2W4I9_9FUNG
MSDSEELVKDLLTPKKDQVILEKDKELEGSSILSELPVDQPGYIASIRLVETLQGQDKPSEKYEYSQLESDEESKLQNNTTTREGPQVLNDPEKLISEQDLETPVSSEDEDLYEDSVEETQPLLNSEEKGDADRLETTEDAESNSGEEKIKEKAESEDTKEKIAAEEEEKQCRICYGGLDDEPSFGKLISPCKCKGTMKYVHLQCLNSWRLASGGKSFFECDSCHYKYNFQRTTMAKAATNPLVLTLCSLLVFVFIIFLAGFPVKLALRSCELEDFEVWDEDNPNITYEDLAPFLSMTNIDLIHMMLGLIMVGVVGFLHFLVSTIAFGGPVPIIGFGYRNGGFRGGNRGDDRFNGGVLLILVAIGTVKAFWTVYKIVRNMSRRSLEAVGAAILEVHD